jgi:uncharacterized protein
MAIALSSAARLFDTHLAAAARGDADAYFELGMTYSTGSEGVAIDMIEAHKWFNLAALAGVREGGLLRAEIASEMARDDIAEAQRQARAWIAALSAAPVIERRAA